ncbi:hypothetical protein QJQ45_028621, partial [Haematococcus lacustris]
SSLAQLSLTNLVSQVGSGSLPPAIETTVRNSGGGAWNHAMWFSTLAPPNSPNTSTTQISAPLQAAMVSSFGSVAAGLKLPSVLPRLMQMGDRANARFGSGWSFLVVKPDGGLFVVDLPNQDNPLMKLPSAQGGIPILGFDVWEHSYYLKSVPQGQEGYGPRKAAFVEALPSVINWPQMMASSPSQACQLTAAALHLDQSRKLSCDLPCRLARTMQMQLPASRGTLWAAWMCPAEH